MNSYRMEDTSSGLRRNHRYSWRWRASALLLLAALPVLLNLTVLKAEEAAPAGADAAGPAEAPAAVRWLTVRLAPAYAPERSVDQLESITEVTEHEAVLVTGPLSGADIAKPPSVIGHRAVLWVRGANVDGKFGFERYYESKYIDRSSTLKIQSDQLGPGEHVINPGKHRFTIRDDGSITSDDPDIIVEGEVVTLKVYGVDIMAARASEPGPPEERLVPEAFGVRLADTAPDEPGPAEAPGTQPAGARDFSNMLSHAHTFYPLRVYLPANSEGPGYHLSPYGQGFRVRAGGRVELIGDVVNGLTADGSAITAEYAFFHGLILSQTGLGAAVGPAGISSNGTPARVSVRPGRTRICNFTAGYGIPSETFALPVEADYARLARMFFVADNRGADPADVRLLVLEWKDEVIEATAQTTVNLRFLQNTFEIREEDVIEDVAASESRAASETQAASGWEKMAAILLNDDAAAAGQRPLSVIHRHLSSVCAQHAATRSVADVLKDLSAKDDKVRRFAQRMLLKSLNLTLHDPAFYDRDGFGGIELSEVSRAALAGPEAAKNSRLIGGHSLLADVFPGPLHPFTRKPSIAEPKIRAQWSRYYAEMPTRRVWNDFDIDEWAASESRDPADGTLTFALPDMPNGFYHFRFSVVDGAAEQSSQMTPYAEMFAAVLRPGQTGTAAFISPKGRDAFVAGETVRLEAVIRSSDPARPAGSPKIVLAHPGGREERVAFADHGGQWSSQPFELAAQVTRQLPPGRYTLTFADLPGGIHPWPLEFDLTPCDPPSTYTIIRNDKYTSCFPMGSWFPQYPYREDGKPIDLDRAVRTLSELGYNRIEFMHDFDHEGGGRRAYMEREQLAAKDPRLPPPLAVFQPCVRDRILNACVRNGMQMAHTLLPYNDFHIPRYIEPYIKASERWISRMVSSMRHSPAFDGMYLYHEMYEWGLMGVEDAHTELWPRLRERAAAEHFGERTSGIRSRWMRQMQRPRGERDREVLARFLDLRRFELASWGDYNSRVARAAREAAPWVRISTQNYVHLQVQHGHGAVCSGIDFDCGFRPEVFRDLDFRVMIHYHDGMCGGWLHSPMHVELMRFDPPRPAWSNVPIVPVGSVIPRDGQYERRMAFAHLAVGSDAISQYGNHFTFEDDPVSVAGGLNAGNVSVMEGRERTRHLNNEILKPFGELVPATEPGYRRVGIVHTANQMILSEFKELRTANQIEELWITCWRLGFPAVFLRADAFERPLEGFDMIFVPGIRIDGELDDNMLNRLQQAIARGTRVVVERNSTLDLDGIVRLDFDINNYYLGPGYNPGKWEDEVYRLFRYTQPAVDYLSSRLPQWAEPAATGPFSVGPNWRRGGDIHYMIMSNMEQVNLSASLKQFVARPSLIPMTVSASRGNAAYDLLRGTRVELEASDKGRRFTADLRRMQGAFYAFLPEAVAGIESEIALSQDGGSVRIGGALVGESGAAINGIFPVRITLTADGYDSQEFFRAIGGGRYARLQLPGGDRPVRWRIDVREALAGYTASQTVERPAIQGSPLRMLAVDTAYVQFPEEVRGFWKDTKEVLLVVGERTSGMDGIADAFAAELEKRGIRVTRKTEQDALRYPNGSGGMPEDTKADGYHTWGGYGSGQQNIKPIMIVDAPLVLMTAAGGSRLLYALEDSGYLSPLPAGGKGLVTQPTVRRARRPFNVNYDTLCLIANDPSSMGAAVAAAIGGKFDTPRPLEIAVDFGQPQRSKSAQTVAHPPAAEFADNNEMVSDVQFDSDGNLYVITWGHGDNLYSFTPEGSLRFSHYLPEMGPFGLGVYNDRLIACTSVGSRLYHIGLDGKPLWQVRLPRDPGMGEERRRYFPHFQYDQTTRRTAFRDAMNGSMRIINEHGEIEAEWFGDAYEDKEDATAGRRREFHIFAISPDGTRIAQLESESYLAQVGHGTGNAYDSYLVIRDMTGKKLATWPEIIANEFGSVTGSVQWQAGNDGPSVTVNGRTTRYDAGLTRVVARPSRFAGAVFDFGEHGALKCVDSRTLCRVDAEGREVAILDRFATFPTIARICPAGKTIFFYDEYGEASFYDAATGKRLASFIPPEIGMVTRFTADGTRLLIGGFRQSLMCYDLQGKLVWRVRLSDHNKTLNNIAPLERVIGFPTGLPYVTDLFPDRTDKHWPPLIDEPGQLDAVVRFDENRLSNGDASASGGWADAGGKVAFADISVNGGKSIRVGQNVVSQEISGYIGDHFTWVLEFYHRKAPGSEAGELSAGLRSQSRHPQVVVRRFQSGDQWKFERVVTKSGANAEAISVAFKSDGGDTLVDGVTLRRIRFPSVNHMLHPPVHDVTPRVLKTPRFMDSYEPLGRLREQIPNRVLIEFSPVIGQGLVEPGFLQNARLNDMDSEWYTFPLGDTTDISMGLREPRWISTVAVYFNAYDEKNITPHYDILVQEIESGQTRLVASVRNNRRLMQISTFPPVMSDSVIVRMINPLARHRTITEVEIYGPLSGRAGDPGFDDPDGQNTYMGNFTRVDGRELVLWPEYGPLQNITGDNSTLPTWACPSAQALLDRDYMHLARHCGYVQRIGLQRKEDHSTDRANSLGFPSVGGAVYGGLWLLPGTDGVLYGIDPASSRTLWSSRIGERLSSGPAAIGSDVIAASDTGRLVALDLGSGALLRETQLTAGVPGSLAADGGKIVLISEDGLLQCIDGKTFKTLWTLPVATWTESTPAISGDIIYLADRLGVVRAVRLSDGSLVWSTELGEEFIRCPVVTADSICLGFRKGKVAALNRADGKLRWQTRINSRFRYEPVPVTAVEAAKDGAAPPRHKAIMVFDRNQARLLNIADGSLLRDWIKLPDLPIASISHRHGGFYFTLKYNNLGHERLAHGGQLFIHGNGDAYRIVPKTGDK